jgi:hypothetical protein
MDAKRQPFFCDAHFARFFAENGPKLDRIVDKIKTWFPRIFPITKMSMIKIHGEALFKPR